MPLIKVWCLPRDQTEDQLMDLYRKIVAAVSSVEELNLKKRTDITCIFPPDLMRYGLGEEIIVEIDGLFEKPELTQEVRQRLAENVGKAVSGLYPEAKVVECLVKSFNPTIQGFWTSVKEP